MEMGETWELAAMAVFSFGRPDPFTIHRDSSVNRKMARRLEKSFSARGRLPVGRSGPMIDKSRSGGRVQPRHAATVSSVMPVANGGSQCTDAPA